MDYNAVRFISEEEKRVLESEGQVSHKGSFYSWNNRKVLYAFMVNNYYKVENYLPLVKVIERLLDSEYKYIVYLNLPNDGWTNRPYLTPYDLSLFDNLTEQEEKLLGVFDIDDSTYDTGPVYLAPEFRITAYTEDQVVQIKRIEEVTQIMKESKMKKQKMYRDDIYDITANIIVQSIDIEDILKAIKEREKSAEDEQGSEGLWDLAFYETISQLEMDLWGADEEAYSYYMSTAEEVYDILVANIDNYKAGRRPVLVESKTINEGGENYWFQVMKEFNLSEEDIRKVASNYRELLYKVYELREFASKNDLIAYSPNQSNLYTVIDNLTEVVKRINFQIENFRAFDLNKPKEEGKAIKKVKGAPIKENINEVGSEYFGEQATFSYVTNPNNPDDDILYEILITDVKGDDVFTIYFGDRGSRNLNQKALQEWIADELNDQRITGVHDGIKVLWTELVHKSYQSFLNICYESADGEAHLDTLYRVEEDITDSFDPEDVKAMFKK